MINRVITYSTIDIIASFSEWWEWAVSFNFSTETNFSENFNIRRGVLLISWWAFSLWFSFRVFRLWFCFVSWFTFRLRFTFSTLSFWSSYSCLCNYFYSYTVFRMRNMYSVWINSFRDCCFRCYTWNSNGFSFSFCFWKVWFYQEYSIIKWFRVTFRSVWYVS